MSEQKIRWREETGSYLPEIVNSEIELLLLCELERHHEGILTGSVVSLETMYRKHTQKQRNDCGELEHVRKSGSEQLITDTDSLRLISQKLAKALGIWIQDYFVFEILHEEFMGKDRLIPLPPERHKKAVSSILKAIRVRKNEVDAFLKSIGQADILEIQSSTQRDDIVKIVADLSQQCAESEGATDRWFHGLCENLSYFTHAYGFPITFRKIDQIASQHFESWVCPTDQASDRFADEIAAIFLKAMFAKKYG